MPRRDTPPSQSWRTFLAHHVGQIMAVDFFVVPTVTYRLLFVLVILAHDRRRIVHVAVTDHPTASWTAQQLRNAFPEDQAPRYLLHDRDAAFTDVMSTIGAMQIHEVLTAPRSPWQNAYVERVIGSIRRECLDHVIVLSIAGLQRVLADYVAYYMNTRTHLSLGKDAPASRPATPLSAGCIVEIPQVNGLHHRKPCRGLATVPKAGCFGLVRRLMEGLRVFSQGRHRWRMLSIGVMPSGAPRLNDQAVINAGELVLVPDRLLGRDR
jgi:hypothetical protein